MATLSLDQRNYCYLLEAERVGIHKPVLTACLEACNFDNLRQAYLADLEADFKAAGLPQNLSYLDRALLAFVDGIPNHYTGLPYQRNALLEAAGIVRELDTREAAIATRLPAADVSRASEVVMPKRPSHWTPDNIQIWASIIEDGDFTCEGLTGNQVYWFLDLWWPGGIARYTKFSHLCHIDASSYRVRWRN